MLKIAMATFLAAILGVTPVSAQIAISKLPSTSALDGTEALPIVQGGSTKQATASQIANTATAIASGANLNTPASVTLSNAIGLPLTTGVTGLLPIANGGTGGSTASTARSSLGLGTAATQNTGASGAGIIPTLDSAPTWTGNHTFTGTINGARVAPSCANILAYGGDNTGSVDNSAAWTAALAGNNGQQTCIYFPRGTYLFSSAATASLASGATGASITIKGDGQEVSTLKFANGVSGLGITLNERTQSFHVEGLSLVTAGNAGTQYGLHVAQTNAASPMPSQSSITNVGIHGSDGYNQTFYWDYGIQLDYVSNVTMSAVNVIGSSAASAYSFQGVCFYWFGSASSLPVQVNIYGSQFNYCNEGIRYGNYAQGLQVTTSNFVGNSIAINVPTSQSGNDELGLSNNQFNSGTRNIYLGSAVDGVMIVGNMFYAGLANAIHVELAVADQFTITANTFVPLGTGQNGIVIGSGGVGSIVTGNVFRAGSANFTTGIWLQSGSSNVNVQSNSYQGATTATINNGTNNTLGGGSQ